MPPLPQIRVFTLYHSRNSEDQLYRLEKGWILRFVLGPSLMAYQVRLFCNQPINRESQFDRLSYQEIAWKGMSGNVGDRTDLMAEVKMVCAGSFNFFFTINNSTTQDQANGSGYFLVDPTLNLGPNNEEISMDAITCQSVITKLLGPFEEWPPRLQVTAESGYNMIHFTPIQELGISNSAYSIRDQLIFSPVYSPGSKKYTFSDVEKLMEHLNKNFGVMSLSDLVYNHTSKDSPWVLQHPECTFNLDNSPHLRPAYVIDRIFENFSLEVGKGLWAQDGIPAEVNSEDHLNAINHALYNKVFPKYRIHEFYCVGIDTILKEFKKSVESNNVASYESQVESLTILQDPKFRRFKSTINMGAALKLYNTDRPGVFSRSDRIDKCVQSLTGELTALNAAKEQEIMDHVHQAISNFKANVRWRFLNPAGPRIPKVLPDEPLMWSYFVIPKSHEGGVEKEEEISFEEGRYVMAVNGWVMGDDPLRNFADPGRNIYLRRELIAWGDSVKLNYGKKPEDCPYLWKRMEDYTKLSAKIFQGLRLDNCHSTPIHVAEHMLDIARKVRPDLYVIAELFTGSEQLDNLFMNRLGINSLIRESLTAWSAHEEGRLVHRFGGQQPVGAYIQPRVRPLNSCMAHALFYDQTHDNESPIEKRSAYDCWPSAALVAISNCAVGSNRGFDQLVPHHINVVTEKRLYPSWLSKLNPETPFINENFGITAGKRILNRLHFMLARNGYYQVYVDQVDAETVSVTRHNPLTHESVVLIARTSFSHPHNPDDPGNNIPPITVEGRIEQILFEGSIRHAPNFAYSAEPDFINGLPDYFLNLKENISVNQSEMIHSQMLNDGQTNRISFKKMTPGSVVAFRSCLVEKAKNSILEIRRGLGQFGYMMRSYSGNTMFDESFDKSNFRAIVGQMNLADLNRCLYRIDSEEKEDNYGFGVYDIPESGPMTYSGLRGIISLMATIRPINDLGHPLCNNLRQGNWLADYTANRLLPHKGTELLGKWFASIFSHLKTIPRFLVPCYFDATVTGAYMVLLEMASDLMSDFIKDGSTFVKALSMSSVQLVGYTRGARLPFLSPALDPPPRSEFNNCTNQIEQACLSMSAGFPHFGAGYMRNWGRDTFIAIRGMLIITGRHQDARNIILAYGGTLRHGLIPNLLNEGNGSRFNCRDSVWFWLQSIQDYCEHVKDGYNFLKDPVSRMYPNDEADPQPAGKVDQPLHDVIQEALNRHAVGVKFRERNAGYQIDDQMTDAGFNNCIGIDWTTGFVFGGNEWNCGTWMDKMGSSSKAGNKGKPATPRDGSAVELVGLCASTVKWLALSHKKGLYPYEGVETSKNGKSSFVKFENWYSLIKENFEKNFYISEIPNKANEPNPELINRRGIYKDSVNATQFWANFQLRCNFPIAMVVAPDLFTAENAWIALENGDVLLGPLGMKTLDPKDWAYNGDYENDNDSEDQAVANGWNYHQGPEWVWPVGYFLRAKLHFANILNKTRPGLLEKTKLYASFVLSKHYEEILNSPWQGLPELTNSNGQYCKGSCRTQAWSASSILEVLHELAKLEE